MEYPTFWKSESSLLSQRGWRRTQLSQGGPNLPRGLVLASLLPSPFELIPACRGGARPTHSSAVELLHVGVGSCSKGKEGPLSVVDDLHVAFFTERNIRASEAM